MRRRSPALRLPGSARSNRRRGSDETLVVRVTARFHRDERRRLGVHEGLDICEVWFFENGLFKFYEMTA